jgi:alkylhydroperoxidase family enzyme
VQEAAAGHRDGHVERAPRRRRAAAPQRALGLVQRGAGRLDVDPGVLRQLEAVASVLGVDRGRGRAAGGEGRREQAEPADDRAILQITLIASWFAYINRVADALGVGRGPA